MKRAVSLLLAVFLVLGLTACIQYSGTPTEAFPDIETLKSWSFQYNKSTNDYSLFFALCNAAGAYVSAEVDVDIRIVNDAGEEIYRAAKSVSKDDFDYYTSKAAGEEFLANVRIPEKDIKAGKSQSGTVYFTVHKGNVVDFNEVNCTASYCLPISDVTLSTDPLPTTINCKSYDGSVASKIQIEGVSYVYDKDILPELKITISGTKTYGTNALASDIICYKIYDSNGYLVDSGTVYLRALTEGDKFKDDSIVLYDLTPGEMYTIKFVEYDW